MDLLNLSKAVDSSQRNVENAREAVRIANLSYNAGLNTLTDVNSAETAYYTAQLAYSKAVTDLNQAIYQFEFAIGKGTGSAA
jgi:outer membrane protein TolC